MLFTIAEPDLRRELYARLSVSEPLIEGRRHYLGRCHVCGVLVVFVAQPGPETIDASRVLGAFWHAESCRQRRGESDAIPYLRPGQ